MFDLVIDIEFPGRYDACMTTTNDISEAELWQLIEQGGEVYGLVESHVCYALDAYGDLVFVW